MRSGGLVSICITSYNYGRFIGDAIESALGQSYPHIEVIISDNASTDSTQEVLAAYVEKDPRVRIFLNATNVGLSRNHNLAIARASGEYVVILSADDVLFPHHVDRLMQRMLDPFDPVSIVHAQALDLNEWLEPNCTLISVGNLPFAYSRRDDFGNIIFNYHHAYPTKLVARSVYERVGTFNEAITCLIDVELSARMEAAKIPTAYLPETLAAIRTHGERMSRSARKASNIWLRDRVSVSEYALADEFAWRIEGYESLILGMLQFEINRLAEEGAEPLEELLARRLSNLRTALTARESSTPPWPCDEPQLSVILVSEGYPAPLKTTLDAVAAQRLELIEILVVQCSGWDLAPWISRFAYADRVRVVQLRKCVSPAHAFRYGLDLARGEYVTYLSEGQFVGDELYTNVLSAARESGAKVLLFPKSVIAESASYPFQPELHPRQFDDPPTRAAKSARSQERQLSQLLHRRSVIRSGSTIHEYMIQASEADFIAHLGQTHSLVVLEAEPPQTISAGRAFEKESRYTNGRYDR